MQNTVLQNSNINPSPPVEHIRMDLFTSFQENLTSKNYSEIEIFFPVMGIKPLGLPHVRQVFLRATVERKMQDNSQKGQKQEMPLVDQNQLRLFNKSPDLSDFRARFTSCLSDSPRCPTRLARTHTDRQCLVQHTQRLQSNQEKH